MAICMAHARFAIVEAKSGLRHGRRGNESLLDVHVGATGRSKGFMMMSFMEAPASQRESGGVRLRVTRLRLL